MKTFLLMIAAVAALAGCASGVSDDEMRDAEAR